MEVYDVFVDNKDHEELIIVAEWLISTRRGGLGYFFGHGVLIDDFGSFHVGYHNKIGSISKDLAIALLGEYSREI